MKSEMYMPNYKGKLGIFFLQTLSNKKLQSAPVGDSQFN